MPLRVALVESRLGRDFAADDRLNLFNAEAYAQLTEHRQI